MQVNTQSTPYLYKNKCLEEVLHLTLSIYITSDTMQSSIPEKSVPKVDYVRGHSMPLEGIENIFVVSIDNTILLV